MRTTAIPAVMAILLSLVACGSDNGATITVKGQLVFSADLSLPDDASARVSIFERREEDGDERIVAERTLHDIALKPTAFELDVARNLFTTEGRYGLRAELASADGRVFANSRKARSIEPVKQADVGRIELKRVAPTPTTHFKTYRCPDGFQLSATIDDERAIVRLGNRRLEMAIDDNGAKYTDDHGNTLTRSDAGIAVRVDDGDHRQCTTVGDTAPPQTGTPPVDDTARPDGQDAERGA